MHSYLHGHPALLHAVRKLEQMNLDKFELFFSRKVATKIEVKNQQVDALSRAEDVGLAVRLIRDHRLGFSYTTSLEKDAIERALQTASDVANFMPEDEHVDLYSFSEAHYPAVDATDNQGLGVAMARKIDLAMQLESECRKADARVTGVRSASLAETAYELHMVDSSGEHISHQATLYGASITCKAEANGDSQVGHEYSFSNFLDTLDVVGTGKRAAAQSTELLGAGKAPTLRCPAILRNDVVANLLSFLSASFSAEEIDKGRSMLAGRKGERIFSERVTIVDDGLMPGGAGTSPFDGDGIPSTRTRLVDGGFLGGALYDAYYARKLGVTPTGNAARGIKAPPSIGITNLYLENGKKNFNQLLDGLSTGILITNLMGVHTANPVTGDFSLGASGILIENGKLTRAVRGFAVAGNVLEVFRKITDTGDDLKFFGTIGAPSVRISELSVGGT